MILSQEKTGYVATVTINRPEKLNALNQALLVEIQNVFLEINTDSSIRCVIVTGAGSAFAAGADIEELATLDSAAATNASLVGKKAFNSIERLRCPVIAAVNGFALGGGCELALACDFIIASEAAKFGLPEAKLGVIPGFTGVQRLAARIGSAMAKELIYSGRMIDAAESKSAGLVNRVVAADQLMTTCQELAKQIVSVGPTAISVTKQTLLDYSGGLVATDDATDAQRFGQLFGTPDQIEGMAAFMEKRKPRFGSG